MHLAALRHYISCNDAAAASVHDRRNRQITTSLPNAVGTPADNNLVDLVDIPNLAGRFNALNGSIRFINRNPPASPRLWRVYVEISGLKN